MIYARPIRRILCIALLIAGLPLPSASAQPIRAVVDSLGHVLVDDRPWGVVVGILANDEQQVYGFGAVDSTGAAPTAHTIFEIGSVTKTFTGLLLAERIERGVLQASDPVQTYLPDSLNVRAHADRLITLVHLATHHAGLPRLPTNLLVLDPDDPYAAYTVGDLYAFLDGYRLDRAPGTTYVYSNLGVGLLGHLLARQADTTFAALIQRRIAEPLGLSDTRIALTTNQTLRFAQGHDASGAPVPPWHLPTLAGAGALRSTAADLLTYVRAHLAPTEDTSLGRAMRRATTPYATTNQSNTRVGLGWHVTTSNGRNIIWHNGGTGGFSSFIGFDRARRHGVVLLANASIGQPVTRAGFALLDALGSAASTRSEPSNRH